MHRTCTRCRSAFEVLPEDLEFFERVSPEFDGVRFRLPPPTHCPDCRLQRRLAHRNEYTYFTRKCDRCGKSVVSVHRPDAPYPVYCYGCWWGDGWNPCDFGSDVDPARSFFDQFHELQERVPQLAMQNDNGVSSENCEYCQDFAFGKNCYLVTASWQDRDCMYCSQCNGDREVLDSFLVNESELAYFSVLGFKLYECAYMIACSGCSSCVLGFDLKECSDCTGCVGLRRKQFCFFNEQLGEAEYRARVSKFALHTRSGLERAKRQFLLFARNFPHRAVQQLNCENCRGDSLSHCKNFNGFGMIHGQDCRYGWQGDGTEHCLDLHVTGRAQWCYEGSCDNSYQTLFSIWSWKNKFLLYCDNCHSSEHLFGCIGMKRGSYCILNRRYSQEEYARLTAQLLQQMSARGEWGEFFPMRHALVAYNDSRAQDLFPLEAAQAQDEGLPWREEDPRSYLPQDCVLPDSIRDAAESLISAVLACGGCRRNYRVTKPELLFYRKMELPVPERCPACRRRERAALYPATGRLFARWCESCKTPLESVFAESSGRQVLCEACYLRYIGE